MGRVLVTPPAEEPVRLAELKAYLRVETDDEDALLLGLGKAAREYAEIFTGRFFCTQTWKLTLPGFPSRGVRLFGPPLAAVTSFSYLDTSGDSQSLDVSDWEQVAGEEPALLMPPWGVTWPATYGRQDAVSVTFTAGYGGPDDVPEGVRQAVTLHVSHFYYNRNAAGPPGVVDAVLTPYRLIDLV